MTRSIFDPTGGETEHSGSRNLGAAASDISHMPPDMGDHTDEAEDENETIDMGNLEQSADAPQESDLIDDPESLVEGQEADDSSSQDSQ